MEKKKLPIYKLVIDDNDESGINYVALVDEPAIQRMWLAFDKQTEYKFKVDSEEKRMITGPLMIADLPIYRRDKSGEFYVIFDKESIEKIMLKFFKRGNGSNVNLMHEKPVDGVFMFEHWIVDKEKGKMTPKGFDEAPDGSSFATFKVDNDLVWDEFIKTGVFKGFSVEGNFKPQYQGDEKEGHIKDLIDMINSLSIN